MSTTENGPFEWVQADEGIRRRVLAHTPDAMTVEVAFDANAVGAPHSHPHLQTVFVQSGKFVFTIDGKETVVQSGDSLVIPREAHHGCKAIEPGTLIDCFVPRRDDFL